MILKIDIDELTDPPSAEPFNKRIISKKELRLFLQSCAKNKKYSIVIFGANWCPDARLLAGVLELPLVKKFLDSYAEILNIDIGDYDINMNLFSLFDSEIKDGVPRVFITDSSERVINLKSNDVMRKARELSAQDIFNYFQEIIINGPISNGNV